MAKVYGVLTFALLLGLAAPTWAVDGVVDINQARAAAGGVSPGDTAGFPVTISQAGSYRLTGNLMVPDANTTAISITADNVTVDLNGFTIQGPVVCIGEPVTGCSPSGTGRGVFSSDPPHIGLTVRNGVIRGMGFQGAWLGARSRFENVTVESNGAEGILAGPGGTSVVVGCIASRNGGDGISTLGTVHSSSAEFNRGSGISGGAVIGSIAVGNGSAGIVGSSVVGSTAESNGGTGINSAGTVANSTARSNSGRGIIAGVATGCFADLNTVSPQILATGITGQNICSAAPCP